MLHSTIILKNAAHMAKSATCTENIIYCTWCTKNLWYPNVPQAPMIPNNAYTPDAHKCCTHLWCTKWCPHLLYLKKKAQKAYLWYSKCCTHLWYPIILNVTDAQKRCTHLSYAKVLHAPIIQICYTPHPSKCSSHLWFPNMLHIPMMPSNDNHTYDA